MGDFIERFQKIQKEDIHLAFSSAKPSGYTMESCDELGRAASTFPESMLVVTENTVGLKMVHDATVHEMFQNLACYGLVYIRLNGCWVVIFHFYSNFNRTFCTQTV